MLKGISKNPSRSMTRVFRDPHMLKGDTKNAKIYFETLNRSVVDNRLFMQKHFGILQRVYPDKFTIDRANELYGK